MQKYVKFSTPTDEGMDYIIDLTPCKVYEVIDGTETIIDDVDYAIDIMTPNWGKSCHHLDGFFWVWCDKNGVGL